MLHNLLQILKTASKRAIQKTAEATGDLIGNKIVDKITKVSNLHHRIMKKILGFIEQYLKKDIYHQKKDSILLMN